MAGGIDWFRWHHGSVTDPKFQLVAKKSGCRLSDVLAVWAFLLEQASASETRGDYGVVDAEAIDCLFGFEDGQTAVILEHMNGRGLIQGGQVEAWERRQPKREREDDTTAERKRRQRDKERLKQSQVEPAHAESRPAEPRHTTSHQKTPRGEESREEESRRGLIQDPIGSSSAPPPARLQAAFDEVSPVDDPKLDDVRVPSCPYDRLLDAYAKALPTLPQPRRSLFKAGKGAAAMRQRWGWVMTENAEVGDTAGQRMATTADEGVAWFQKFFAYVAESPFLLGQAGDRRWSADLVWLMTFGNFTKVLGGNYHSDQREVAHA